MSNLDVRNLDDLLSNNPLLLIDIIITQHSKAIGSEDSYDLVLQYLLKAIIKYLNIGDIEGNLEYIIFDNKLRESHQKFIAVCLLRLLSSNDNFFPAKDVFRNRTFVLFDNVFCNDLYKYKEINLTINEQGFIKESRLIDFLLKYEKLITEKFDISSLNIVNSFKQDFYSNINSHLNEILINPFLPEGLTQKSKFKELFDVINEYINSIDKHKIVNYNKAISILNQYVEDAYEFNTEYSKKFLGNPFARICRMVKEDFTRSPLSKPAELTLHMTEKKYPFNIIGAKFRISFYVSNSSVGHAFSTIIRIDDHNDSIKFTEKQQHAGEISIDNMLVEFDCEVIKPDSNQIIILYLLWNNFDDDVQSREYIFELKGQKSNLNWDSLKYEEPYSWEPVDTEERLIGRREILDRLWTGITKKGKISSFYIYGQKRVGKTSIVKTLESKVLKSFNNEFIVLYLEGGEYKAISLYKTIQSLGEIICLRIKAVDTRFTDIETPKFEGALSPLTRFLDRVAAISPYTKILFILDEFDEISSELYKRGEIADSLFLTIRAISNKPNYAFLLVGGEKMGFIISCQGEQLNKFQSIRVDYFDKENYWADFQELVRKPVNNILEITDKALEYLYNQTSGNPFFTIIVCAKLFAIMVERRDTHVTEFEMEQAVKHVIKENGTQIFSHFWEDGIKHYAEKEEEVSIVRRKVLISIARTIINTGEAKREHVIDNAVKSGINESSVIENLKEFVERQILIEKQDRYYFKINIFSKWLIEKGINEIITTLSDAEKIKQNKISEEQAQVKSEEIIELLKTWHSYDGREITTDIVRRWLNQFGENSKQRLMFKILQGITFYSNYSVKQKMKEIYKYILDSQKLIWKQEEGRKRRNDILVSYLENNISKSGPEYAKIFTDQNNIYASNAIEKSKIYTAVKQNTNIKALLFVDDFIGTGDSISDNLISFIDSNPEIRELDIKIYIGVITGFLNAKDKIEQTINKLGINASVYICSPLHDENKCFNEKSTIFLNQNERMLAKDICYEHGIKLVKDNAFGYGNCEATVIFPNTCPNNCLPILWSCNNGWFPIFPRRV